MEDLVTIIAGLMLWGLFVLAIGLIHPVLTPIAIIFLGISWFKNRKI